MGSQENTEKALRQLHMLISKADTMPDNLNKAIVDKRQAEVILTELNRCIYEMFEEYEVTRESKERTELAIRREGERQTKEAQKRAEDVYAASIMYSDDALTQVVHIMQQASQSVERVYQEMLERIHEQEKTVRTNQSELRSQLHTMQDTEKYLQMIRDQRAAEEREERLQKGIERRPINIYANRRSEVKVNHAALKKLGVQPVVEDMDSLVEDLPENEIALEAQNEEGGVQEKKKSPKETGKKAASEKKIVVEAETESVKGKEAAKPLGIENEGVEEKPAANEKPATNGKQVVAEQIPVVEEEQPKPVAAAAGAPKNTKTVKKVVKKVVKKPVIKDNFAGVDDDDDDLVTINLDEYDL